MKRLLILTTLIALAATACGSSDDDSASATTAAPTTSAAPTTAAPATTTAPTTAAADAAGAIDVELLEFELITGVELEAGEVTFNLTNTGEFGHELAIARGDTYENLPLSANGAVDEDALGADFLGRSETVDSGQTGAVTFDLAPGTYVFMCNIQFGPNSHAANGQTLTVTVT